MRAYLYLGLGAGVAAFWWWRSQTGGSDPVSEAIVSVTDVVTKGKRLTTTVVNADGVIPDDPATLADQAVTAYGSDFSLPGWSALEIYALARMSRSEAGGKAGARERKARMHIAINDFLSESWAHSLDELFTYSTNAAKRGKFGKQETRRYSTAQDPYAGDIKLALDTLNERRAGIDPTGGASKFVDVSGFAPGRYEEIVAQWGAEGYKPATIDGLSSDFVVFRKDA